MAAFTSIKTSGSIAFLETPDQIMSRQLSVFGLTLSAPPLKGHWYDGKPLSLIQLQSPSMLMVDAAETFSNVIVSVSQALGTIPNEAVYFLDNHELLVFKNLPDSVHGRIRNKLAKLADAHLLSGIFDILEEEDLDVQSRILATFIDQIATQIGLSEDRYIRNKDVLGKIAHLKTILDNESLKGVKTALEAIIRYVFITPRKLEESPFAAVSVLNAIAPNYLDEDALGDGTDMHVAAEFYKRHTPVVKTSRTLFTQSYGNPGDTTLTNLLKLSEITIDYVVAVSGGNCIHSTFRTAHHDFRTLINLLSSDED